MRNPFHSLAEIGVIPVIAIDDAAMALPLADALLEGGIPCAEITFRTPAAARGMQAPQAAVLFAIWRELLYACRGRACPARGLAVSTRCRENCRAACPHAAANRAM